MSSGVAVSDRVRDSLDDVNDKKEDSLDRVSDHKDRVQDSIQEAAVGAEGRTLRLSAQVAFATHDDKLLLSSSFALVNRFDFVEIGLQEIAFYESGDDNGKYYFTLSPSVGFVPFLTRPFRMSAGVGSSVQFGFNNAHSECIAPFLYVTGTVFFVKRVSSSVSFRVHHAASGDFLYSGLKHRPIHEGSTWGDMMASVDFYF